MVKGELIDVSGKPLVSTSRKERMRKLSAAYEAAPKASATDKHFANATAESARDANDPATRETLRARSRSEFRQNNSFGVGIIRTLENDIVGRGPSLQITDPRLTKEQKSAIERRHRAWSRASRLTSCLQTAIGSEFVDGETFLHESTNVRQMDDCKLTIVATEADQITTSVLKHDNEFNIDGVHIDQQGFPYQYERLRFHPNDSYGTAGVKMRNYKSDTETIGYESMIHLFKRERPGQHRGIPRMVSALPLCALFRRYTLAVVLCAESAAHHHGVVYTDHTSLEGVDGVDPMDQIELEFGQWTTMPEGWKLGQLKAEQPTTVYEMFRNAIINEVARCVSMPKNKALGDSGGYNYASGMLDFQTYYEMIQVERNRLEIEALDRILGWWFDEAVLIGGYLPELPALPGGIDHVWRWDEFKHVDPTKMANATETLWHLGLVSDSEYLLAKGTDPEEHYQRLQEQNKRRAELGLPLPGGSTPMESLDRRAKQAEADKAEQEAEAAA